jgi:hypothetical protein
MSLNLLILENPSFQCWSDGTPANWSVAPDVLRFIHRHVSRGMRTLETGAGQTTVAFALAGARHTAITLDPGEAERIRAWCVDHGVEADLTFIHESSDIALARGDGIPQGVDFVFIDGAHRFPFPCLDWHYTERRLKVGGIVAVDDYQMPSVRILHDFLEGEDEWELIEVLGRTSFFRRLRETVVINDCWGQRLNQRQPDTVSALSVEPAS